VRLLFLDIEVKNFFRKSSGFAELLSVCFGSDQLVELGHLPGALFHTQTTYMHRDHRLAQDVDDVHDSCGIDDDYIGFNTHFPIARWKRGAGEDCVLGACLDLILPQLVLPSLADLRVENDLAADLSLMENFVQDVSPRLSLLDAGDPVVGK